MRFDKDPKHQCGQVQKDILPDYSNVVGTRHEYVSQADRTHRQVRNKWKAEGSSSGT